MPRTHRRWPGRADGAASAAKFPRVPRRNSHASCICGTTLATMRLFEVPACSDFASGIECGAAPRGSGRHSGRHAGGRKPLVLWDVSSISFFLAPNDRIESEKNEKRRKQAEDTNFVGRRGRCGGRHFRGIGADATRPERGGLLSSRRPPGRPRPRPRRRRRPRGSRRDRSRAGDGGARGRRWMTGEQAGGWRARFDGGRPCDQWPGPWPGKGWRRRPPFARPRPDRPRGRGSHTAS